MSSSESSMCELSCMKQYVEKIIFASDEFGPSSSISYTAVNLIGRPLNYPHFGDFINSYLLSTFGDWRRRAPSYSPEFGLSNVPQNQNPPVHDFLVVSFENPVFPQSLEIYETFHPGAVYRIWAFTLDSKWELLWDKYLQPEEAASIHSRSSRCFRPKIRQIEKAMRVMRLDFNTRDLSNTPGYDAILLSGTKFTLQEFAIRTNEQLLKEKNRSSELCSSVCQSNSPPSGTLNFMQLPYEIVFIIFSNLDIPSLRSAEKVCHKFYEIIRDPRLFVEINLRPYWMKVNSKMIKWVKSRSVAIRKLNLSWCGMFSYVVEMDINRFLEIRGATITHLCLDDVAIKFSEETLCSIAIFCPNLEEVSLKQVSISRDVRKVGFKNLIRLNLARTAISTECLVEMLPDNPRLKHLNISCCVELNTEEVATTIARCNRELVSLNMWRDAGLQSTGLRALQVCTKLRELDIGWNIAQENLDGALGIVLKNCPDMLKLVLAGIRFLQDSDLIEIATYCPKLEQLDLMGCLGVTSLMVQQVLNRCDMLQYIDISYCEKIDRFFIERWKNAHKHLAIID